MEAERGGFFFEPLEERRWAGYSTKEGRLGQVGRTRGRGGEKENRRETGWWVGWASGTRVGGRTGGDSGYK